MKKHFIPKPKSYDYFLDLLDDKEEVICSRGFRGNPGKSSIECDKKVEGLSMCSYRFRNKKIEFVHKQPAPITLSCGFLVMIDLSNFKVK